MEVVPRGLAIVMNSLCSSRSPDRRTSWTLLPWSVESASADTVFSQPDPQVIAVHGQRFCTVIPYPDGRTASLAVRPDGTAAYGDGTSYEIRIFRLAAAPASRAVEDAPADDALSVMLLRRDAPRPELPPDAIAKYRERVTRPPSLNTTRDDWFQAIEAALDTPAWPRYRAAFNALEWDDRGNLWVRRVGEEDAQTVDWDVFDPELNYLGAVSSRPPSRCTRSQET